MSGTNSAREGRRDGREREIGVYSSEFRKGDSEGHVLNSLQYVLQYDIFSMCLLSCLFIIHIIILIYIYIYYSCISRYIHLFIRKIILLCFSNFFCIFNPFIQKHARARDN